MYPKYKCVFALSSVPDSTLRVREPSTCGPFASSFPIPLVPRNKRATIRYKPPPSDGLRGFVLRSLLPEQVDGPAVDKSFRTCYTLLRPSILPSPFLLAALHRAPQRWRMQPGGERPRMRIVAAWLCGRATRWYAIWFVALNAASKLRPCLRKHALSRRTRRLRHRFTDVR